MADLRGKRALITGGGTGIGYGCADELLAQGAAVTIAARRRDVLEASAGRLRSAGTDRTVEWVECDITNEEQVADAVRVASGDEGLDILVANSATASPGAILQLSPEGWLQTLSTNVVGTALCIKHAGLSMRDHGRRGSIIAISSTSATKVQPWLATYVVSKAALDQLVRCAAIELAQYGVRVNCIQPGYVPHGGYGPEQLPGLDARVRGATPMGRPGTPADVARTVAFLASEDAGWITGQVFGVDGGLNIPVMPSMHELAIRRYGEDIVREYPLPDLTAINPAD